MGEVPAEDDDLVEAVYTITIGRIRNVVDPYRYDIWCSGTILTKAAVRNAINAGRLESRSHEIWGCPPYEGKPLNFDAERVAYLVLHPDRTPICIEVKDFCGYTVIIDGCHRVAAALYRKEKEIDVTFGGYVKAFHRRFKPRLIG